MYNNKPGFTLVELLIVIAIICALASLVVSIGGSAQDKARTANTSSTILALSAACDQYRAMYYVYPTITNRSTTDSTFTKANLRTNNHDLMFVLEEGNYIIDEVRHEPPIRHKLPKSEDSLEYIDAWDNFIRVWPGRKHSANTPPGPDNLDSSSLRNRRMPDIYSIGRNGQDDTPADAEDTGTFTLPDDYDDIVSWRIKIK